MNPAFALLDKLLVITNTVGEFLPQLGLRLLLAYEFWESGVEKFRGENWFADIQDKFPFPFDLVPVDVSWQLSTWSELLGSVALVIGLGTRFFSVSLVILTLVAWASVHAGHGYNVCQNGFKLPLIYLIMFLPLVFSGPGKLSVDQWLWNKFGKTV
ncbi:MAG: HvfX family Cu-binding RiPP maturation protein [Burkholderiales bacterium]